MVAVKIFSQLRENENWEKNGDFFFEASPCIGSQCFLSIVCIAGFGICVSLFDFHYDVEKLRRLSFLQVGNNQKSKLFCLLMTHLSYLNFILQPSKWISSTVWVFSHGKPNDSEFIFWFLRRGRSAIFLTALLYL